MALVRGYYGPQPAESLAPSLLARSRRQLLSAGLFGRHAARHFGFRSLAANERQDLARAIGAAAFEPWIPNGIPRAFRVERTDIVPYSRDVVTILLSDGAGRSFEIAQRRRWLPLAEELSAAKVPFDRVPFVRRDLYLVHGKFGGEPIDRSFWSTRRGVYVEAGDIVAELREVVGRGPGLGALIALALTCRLDDRGMAP